MIRTLLLLLALSGPVQADWSVPPAGAPVPPLPASIIAPRDVPARFEAALTLMRELQSVQPDLGDQVLSLQIDPEAAFALIRDEVQSLPYEGRLRAPREVLLARAGNAHDKARALAELLARMGHDTRLVAGTGPVAAPPVTCADGLDPLLWQATGLGESTLARLRPRAAASYALLRPHLSPAGTEPVSAGSPHVWVQFRDGTEWVDLDPWAPDTPFGTAPAGPGQPLDQQLPPHRLTITLEVETLSDGALSTREILGADLDVPDLPRAVIALGFGPRIEGLGGGLLGTLETLQGGGASLVANLMIDGETRTSQPFAAPGATAGFLQDGTPQEITTAVTLLLTLRVPGQPDRTERRPILDLVPPELRAAGTLTPADLTPVRLGERLPAALESLRVIHLSTGAAPARLMAGLAVRQMLQLPDLSRRAEAGALDGGDLLQAGWLQAGRVALASDLLLRASCLLPDRPRVLIWGVGSGADGRIAQWLDWTFDEAGVIGGDANAQAEARLWQGALQAALETEAMLRLTLSPDDLIPPESAALQPSLPEGEAAGDAAQGFAILRPDPPEPGRWWRLNQATGEADARGAVFGNMRLIEWGAERAAASRTGMGTVEIAESEVAYIESRTSAQIVAETEAAIAEPAAASAASPKCGGTEYLILGTCVSIPGSIATGFLVITVVYTVFYG